MGRGGCLDEGAVVVEGVKVVVEDGLADDVQSELGELGLHVHRLARACSLLNSHSALPVRGHVHRPLAYQWMPGQ